MRRGYLSNLLWGCLLFLGIMQSDCFALSSVIGDPSQDIAAMGSLCESRFRRGMSQEEARAVVRADLSLSGYHEVLEQELRNANSVVVEYLPLLNNPTIQTVVYENKSIKCERERRFLLICFSKDTGLMDAFWVQCCVGVKRCSISAFGGGDFEDSILRLKRGETLESVLRKLGREWELFYSRDAFGVWCAVYSYVVNNISICIWFDAGSATLRSVLINGPFPRKWESEHLAPTTQDTEQIVEAMCSELNQAIKHSGEHPTIREIQAKTYASHLTLLLCHDTEERRKICLQLDNALQTLVEEYGKLVKLDENYRFPLSIAKEKLARFRYEESQTLYIHFPEDTVDLAPLRRTHHEAATACVKLAKQAYDNGMIEREVFCEILLCLKEPQVRSIKKNNGL